MQVNEENVVQQIKMKNEKSLRYIIEKYGGLLNAIIQRYLHENQQDREECLADVLVSIWFHIDSFDPSKNEFKQWIAAIAKYRAIDYVRKSMNAKQHVSKHEVGENIASHSDSETIEISSLLKELSDTERIIFEKYYVEGVPSREIANEFKARDSWVHNKLSRGRKKLKTILMKSEV